MPLSLYTGLNKLRWPGYIKYFPQTQISMVQSCNLHVLQDKEVVMCVYKRLTVQYDQTHLDFLWALEIS